MKKVVYESIVYKGPSDASASAPIRGSVTHAQSNANERTMRRKVAQDEEKMEEEADTFWKTFFDELNYKEKKK